MWCSEVSRPFGTAINSKCNESVNHHLQFCIIIISCITSTASVSSLMAQLLCLSIWCELHVISLLSESALDCKINASLVSLAQTQTFHAHNELIQGPRSYNIFLFICLLWRYFISCPIYNFFFFLPPASGAVCDQDHRLPVRLCIKTVLNYRLILPSPFSRQKYSLCAKWLEGRLNWASDSVRQQQDCSRASRGQK